MRAALLHACGDAPSVGEHALPSRPAGVALVAVTAAPITPLDVLCATGTSYFGTPATPYVPGVQGVGTIVESDVHPAGTRVWFSTVAGMAAGDGAFAEHAHALDDAVLVLPDGVDDQQVAALGLSAVAAWGVLTRAARLQPGEHVLVLGGGGIVGQVAIQAARVLGAGRVVAAARSAGARERAAAAGADVVVPIDDDSADTLAEALREACDGPVDVVVDPLFGAPATAAARVLAPHGRLVNLGGSASDSATFRSSELRSKPASVIGYTNNDVTLTEQRAMLAEVLSHAVAGRISVRFDPVPLADVAAAWAAQTAGTTSSRIVLTL